MPQSTKPLDEPTVRKGPIESSKRVLRRIKSALKLCGVIEAQKARAAAGFSLRFADDLQGGEAVPDQTLALELAGRSVTRAAEELEQADKTYCGHGRRRAELNQECIDVARWQVYPELVDVRRSIDAAFGRDNGRHLHGIEGKTLRKPERLHPQLDGLVNALEDRERALPKPLRPDKVDLEGWREQLEPGYRKLTAMLEQLEHEERLEQGLRQARDYELESFDVVYSEALAFVRSVLCLGGIGDNVIWHLLPNIQRRRLRGKARQEREARVEGLRRSNDPSESDDSEKGN